MRLSLANIDALPARIRRPGYAVGDQACGIVHLGLGAFHRAHQAVYTDAAMNAGERDWRIIGVSLRSPATREKLMRQDGLYTVNTKSMAGQDIRVIGSIARVLVAPENPKAVIDALAAPATRIVTLTVTEKGYYQSANGEGLDTSAPSVAQDRSGGPPATIYGYLAAALAVRRKSSTGGLTVLSCDNMAHNGQKLARSLLGFLDEVDPDLADWTRRTCTFPSSMVDRIVPATTDEDRAGLRELIGCTDEGAVFTEPFSQWVIEDHFKGPRPGWEQHGAELVADVAPYETAKLRMLNGAHSALAYLGLAKGLNLVSEAIADPQIGPLVSRLMRDEAATSFSPAPNQNLSSYADQLEARFANPALPHRLVQIAIDGSQKIPQRWLATLKSRQDAGRESPAILQALASWIRHTGGPASAVDDPMRDRLAALWRTAGQDSIASALFAKNGLFADHWTASDAALIQLTSHVRDSQP